MASVGHATRLRVFIDPDLLQFDEVWAAGGSLRVWAALGELVRSERQSVSSLRARFERRDATWQRRVTDPEGLACGHDW